MSLDFSSKASLSDDSLTRDAALTESTDAAASTATSYTLAVDDTVTGHVGTSGDKDWYKVTLTAGEGYVFSAWGATGQSTGVDDTLLSVYNSNGTLIASNDDVTSYNRFSLIDFTASYSGTYYVAVGAYGSETGAYTLQVADDVYTPEQISSYTVDFDWGISAPIHFDAEAGDTITVNITGLTADAKQLALWALEAWSIATGITFTTTTSATANIIFDDTESGAFAGPVSYNPNTGILTQASVNVGADWVAYYGSTIDSYSFQTYIHEIGHALGLGHTGPYDGSATYGTDNAYLNDSTVYSIMSYFSPEENTTIDGDFLSVITPMMSDYISMETLYGGGSTAYSGNTTWGANSNVGGYLGEIFGMIFDGDAVDSDLYAGAEIVFTIYDTGGYDTLDVSVFSTDQVIDLTPEGISDIDGVLNSMTIASGTIVEAVLSGAGDDTITGNSANNSIDAGTGNDVVDGGAGSDTAVIAGTMAAATVTVLSSGLRIVSADGTDLFTNVEYFQFADGTYSYAQLTGEDTGGGGSGDGVELGDDTETEDQYLTGGTGDDTIYGGAGDDLLTGNEGDDEIYGSSGDDGLRGNSGADTIDGGAGNDNISGSDGNDILDGGDGDDLMGGGLDNDSMSGGTGNDFMGGGMGNDTVSGDGGNDTVNGGAGDDLMMGETGNDIMGASFGNDTLDGGEGADAMGGGSGRDYLWGGSGDDSIGGGEGDDTINGLGGDDLLSGGDGNDLLSGGDGNDGLQGQGGNDTLVGGNGNDNLAASDGDDMLQGDAGDDLMGGGTGNDSMDGGDGNDFMGGGMDNDTMTGGTGNDTVNGGAGNDSMDGGDGNDIMGASFGNDTLMGGTGNDDMGGGTGRDYLTGNGGNDSIGGGEGDDTIFGGAGDDFLAGGGRHDLIDGGLGDDVINGGQGDDTMTGGDGADVFVFNGMIDGDVDTILDFEDGVDMFRISGVENAPGSGMNGYVAALNITNTTIDGEAGVSMTYGGQVIYVVGVSAAELTKDDFIFA
ncbi:M10 family metallopeptidase C-terminal domain-containing protein [Rhodobacter xanthinilyticus]|nr:M10 family metallopeptidase C-terminal domain-containing protein [Rhodobacter xanthinilyticus]